MSETPFELNPRDLEDVLDALRVAAEDLDYRTSDPLFENDYTDEDQEEMIAQAQRMDVLIDKLTVVLSDHYLGRDEPVTGHPLEGLNPSR